jgi:DNA polymerase-3 subunit epsilon
MVGGAVVCRESALVDPGRPIPEEATAVHGITDDRVRAEGIPLDVAMGMVADALGDAWVRGVPVVGMKLDYDLTIVDVQCRSLNDRGLADRGFSTPVLDILVLDRHLDCYRKGSRSLSELCAHYGVVIDNAHDAAADAAASLEVLAAMAARYDELSAMTPPELHRAQMEWHREWATSYDGWRRGEGMSALDPRDYAWPFAEGEEAAAGAA